MALDFFHQRLGFAMLLYLFLITVWALFALILRRPVSRSIVPAFILAEGLVVLQGLFGFSLLATGHQPARWLHIIYGLAAAVSIPAGVYYAQGRSERARAVVYTLLGLWAVGLSLRGFMTGS